MNNNVKAKSVVYDEATNLIIIYLQNAKRGLPLDPKGVQID